MDNKKKLFASVFAGLVVLGLLVIAGAYTGRNAERDVSADRSGGPPAMTTTTPESVPDTPDAVADDILKQASVDESALDDEGVDVDALLKEDSSSVDNLSKAYEDVSF